MSARASKIAADVLGLSKAGDTEVSVVGGTSALTRFANNTIHQNVAEEDLSVTVRAVEGKRIGIASSNDTSTAGLRKLAETALEVARNQPETPDFAGLPEGRPIAEVQVYSRETAAVTPASRATAAAEIIKPAASADSVASGTVSNENAEFAVANSRGVHAAFRSTEFSVSAVIEKGGGAGYAAGVSWTTRRVNVQRIGATALQKCLDSENPQPVEPGEYTVVLEPQAVGDLISYFAYMALGAQAFVEKRSYLSGRIGQKVMHESVSIWDDGLNINAMPVPFDYEGMPKQRVELIQSGTARGVVYDTHYGAKTGAGSTGHALPPGFAGGPLPTNLLMEPGTSSLEEMIRSTERGLLVTRFHYVNIADPVRAVLTGLTRDGTFLIDAGRVSHPVRNLRFTESIPRAFSDVEALSLDRTLVPGMLSATLVPAAKLASFRFTGTTEF